MSVIEKILNIDSASKEMDPKEFLRLASSKPEIIKSSRFLFKRKIGSGLSAKVLVEFEYAGKPK